MQDFLILSKHSTQNNSNIWFELNNFLLRFFEPSGSTVFDKILLLIVKFNFTLSIQFFYFCFEKKYQDLFNVCEFFCSIKISLDVFLVPHSLLSWSHHCCSSDYAIFLQSLYFLLQMLKVCSFVGNLVISILQICIFLRHEKSFLRSIPLLRAELLF